MPAPGPGPRTESVAPWFASRSASPLRTCASPGPRWLEAHHAYPVAFGAKLVNAGGLPGQQRHRPPTPQTVWLAAVAIGPATSWNSAYDHGLEPARAGGRRCDAVRGFGAQAGGTMPRGLPGAPPTWTN